MRKITLSIVSVLALSGLAMAGGDIMPVEEPVVVEPVVDSSAFYVGIGYGYFDQTVENIAVVPSVLNKEFEADSILLQAGYQYNEYLAFEGRYWIGVSGVDSTPEALGDGDFDAWGLYVKPMYPVTEAFDIYALLGYADSSVSLDNGQDWDIDGFSWGLGAQYAVTDNILIFADYVSIAADDTLDYYGADVDADIDLYTVNVGVSYKF